MKRRMEVFMSILCFLLLIGTANAGHITEVSVRYDYRYYPEFVFSRGGAEGHSGAYIQIVVGIDGYYDIQKIRAKAKHETSGFKISLKEIDPSCVDVSPFDNVDQYFCAWLRPEDWMKGEWTITLNYKEGGVKKEETSTVIVPRFNFPPPPTGIQLDDWEGKTWLVWNSIGDPGTYPDRHVEYRIAHLTTPFPHCIDEWYNINTEGGGYPYQLWSGNRIAVELPGHWVSKDLVRIENRIYDNKDGVYRHDRSVKFFFLP